MIKGIDHVAISTKNYDEIIGFYRDIIGFEVVCGGSFKGELYDSIMALNGASGKVALLRLGDSQLEIFEFVSPVPKAVDYHRPVCDHGITHICFNVVDIESVYRRLKASGMHFHCAPQCFGREGKATYGRDPDGNVIELFEPRSIQA